MARFDRGWIKIHRSLLEGDIAENPICLALIIKLIAWANIRESTVRWKGRPRKCPRGSLVASQRELADKFNVDRKTIARHLNYLVERATILVEKSPQGLFITVLNYEEYQQNPQDVSPPSPHGMVHDRDHGMDNEVPHIEEGKKERRKEDKNTSPPSAPPPLPRIAELWNQHAPASLSRVRAMSSTSKRRKLCEARWREVPDENYWVGVIERIGMSPGLTGKNDRAWTADIEFLVRPDNASKVLEGRYDNWGARAAQGPQTSDPFAFLSEVSNDQ